MAHVVVKLTKLEARALSLVADNGWGDGDFYAWLKAAQDGHLGAACIRACEKLSEAIKKEGA